MVSDPLVSADQRFPMGCVVPVTGTPGEGALFPRLSPRPNGFRKESFALVDQLRSVDKRRVLKIYGQIAPAELAAVDEGVRLYLGLVAAGARRSPQRQ